MSDKPTEQLVRLIQQSKAIENRLTEIRRQLSGQELRCTQGDLLNFLRQRRAPMSVRELNQHFGVQNCYAQIKRLVEQQQVYRTPEGKYAYIAKLTPEESHDKSEPTN